MVEESENRSRETRKHTAIPRQIMAFELVVEVKNKRGGWIKVKGFIEGFQVRVQKGEKSGGQYQDFWPEQLSGVGVVVVNGYQ